VRDDALRALYAGTLAWIYDSCDGPAHADTVLSGGVTLGDYYRHLSEEVIGGKEEGYFADGNTDEIYRHFSGLLGAVYEAKLAALAHDPSLPEAYGQNLLTVLNRAQFDIRACHYADGIVVDTPEGAVRIDGEDGYSHRHIYERTLAAMELCELLELLYPDSTLESLPRTEGLVSALGGADTPSRVNGLLGNTLDGLLLDLGGTDEVGNHYFYTYVNGLRTAVAEVFADAEEDMALADTEALSFVFDRYP
jgi:hypothetical protein